MSRKSQEARVGLDMLGGVGEPYDARRFFIVKGDRHDQIEWQIVGEGYVSNYGTDETAARARLTEVGTLKEPVTLRCRTVTTVTSPWENVKTVQPPLTPMEFVRMYLIQTESQPANGHYLNATACRRESPSGIKDDPQSRCARCEAESLLEQSEQSRENL